jgi:hypothetical protein
VKDVEGYAAITMDMVSFLFLSSFRFRLDFVFSFFFRISSIVVFLVYDSRYIPDLITLTYM